MKHWVHPYENLSGGTWLRGNLHTHTTQSDGARAIEDVVRDYRCRGYDFLMISDHDWHTALDECEKLHSGEMILLPGNEITSLGCHILHVNAGRCVVPHANRQEVLDEIGGDASSFSIICHPNWGRQFDHAPVEQLRIWKGYCGIEIFNGCCIRDDGSATADGKWDMLLSEGRRVWGYANDDSHLEWDVEQGWNHVYVQEVSIPGIVNALRAGRFYASTGIRIVSFRVEGSRLRVETENAERMIAICDVGKCFARVDGPCIEVEPPPNATYVRIECLGAAGTRAWTQPFFINAETNGAMN